MTRRGLATALTTLGVVLLLVSVTRWVDVVAGGLFPPLQALGPFACVTALVVALVALALHPTGTTQRVLGALVVIDLLSALLFTRTPAAPAPGGSPDASITVVSANVGMGHGDPERLLHHAEEVGADVLVLLEADRWFVKALDEAGATDRFPHRVVSHDDAPAATAVLSRDPFEEVTAPELTFASAAIRVESGLTVRGVHPAPPLADLATDWRRDLAAIDTWSRKTSGPLVVAGDFNASVSHPAFRQLCRGEDALRGCGGVFARPTWAPPGWIALLPLDHVLVRDAAVAERGSFAVEGSDHRAVWARVVVD